MQDHESSGAYEIDLHCVPRGWYVSNTINWFKDGSALYKEISGQRLQRILKAPFSMENVSEFQGYYYCSIDVNKPSKHIFSSKVLVRFPGLHTFVLHMKSKTPESKKCSDLISLQLPLIEEFNHDLNVLYSDRSKLFLKEVTCSDSVINSYHHVYIRKDKITEKELQKSLESFTLLVSYKRLNINHDDITLKSTVSCPKEISKYKGHTLTWPETSIGESTFPDEVCITEEGSALERQCLGDFYTGAHWNPVEKDCVGVQSYLTITLHELAKRNITEDNVLNSSLSMERLTTSEDLGPADVQYVVQILRNIARIPEAEPQVLRAAVHTVDAVIAAMSISENRGILSNLSSKITSAMENITLNADTNDQVIKVAGNNIAMYVLPVEFIPRGGILENWGSNVTVLLNDSKKNSVERLNQLESYEAAALLPENVLEKNRSNNAAKMAMAVRKNTLIHKNANVVVPVIDLALGSEPVYDVDPPLEMSFKIPKITSKKKEQNWKCVTWDQTLNNNVGGWSPKGCYSDLSDPTHVRCYCDHLSTFTVLLEIRPGLKISKTHTRVLSIITYIGCSLSIVGLGIVILTFALFRKWRDDIRHKVLFNLSLSLISFLLIFLIGIEKKRWGYGCMVVAVLLHYFMLSSFTWMLVEAFLQYLYLVKVIGTYIPCFLQKAISFAWGIPVIIIVITLSVNHKLHRSRTEFCWLSGDAFYFGVVTPVSILLAINFILFVVIFYSFTCGRSKERLRKNQNEMKDRIARAKAIFCVSVLLGLSWVFGFLAAMEGTKLLFQYLFVTSTTLQGFLFCFLFVFRQKNTRKLWMNLMKTAVAFNSSQSTELKQNTRELVYNGPGSSEPWSNEEDKI